MWKARTNSSSLIVASAVLVALAAFAWSSSAVSALMLVSALMIGHRNIEAAAARLARSRKIRTRRAFPRLLGEGARAA